jgi:hypothetical protein
MDNKKIASELVRIARSLVAEVDSIGEDEPRDEGEHEPVASTVAGGWQPAHGLEIPVFHYLDEAADVMRGEVLTQILAARDVIDKQGKTVAYKELMALYKVMDRAADELEKVAKEFNRSGT